MGDVSEGIVSVLNQTTNDTIIVSLVEEKKMTYTYSLCLPDLSQIPKYLFIFTLYILSYDYICLFIMNQLMEWMNLKSFDKSAIQCYACLVTFKDVIEKLEELDYINEDTHLKAPPPRSI